MKNIDAISTPPQKPATPIVVQRVNAANLVQGVGSITVEPREAYITTPVTRDRMAYIMKTMGRERKIP